MTPELVAKVVEGTGESLHGRSETDLASARDRAMLDLLDLKKAAGLSE